MALEQQSKINKPGLIDRRKFLGMVGSALAVAVAPGCSPSKDSASTSRSTIPELSTTSITTPTTTGETVPQTTETPTTIAERVFTSPEQKAQVEAVEANMKTWFAKTPEDIAKYKETTHFDPDPDGFSTISSDPIGSIYSMLGVNLGVFPIPTAGGLGFVSVVGGATDDGSVFAFLIDNDITDPIFSNALPGFRQSVSSHTVAADRINGVLSYSVDITTDFHAPLVHDSTDRGEMIDDLKNSIGQPVVVSYLADPVQLNMPAEYQVKPNLKMKEIMAEINQASIRRDLGKVLKEFSTETLQSVGFYKEMAKIPQTILNGYDTVGELLSTLPLSNLYRLFDGIAVII